MNKKQILSIALLVGMLLTVLSFATACSNTEETVTVHVKIIGLDNDILCDKEVAVTGRDLSVRDSLEQACEDVGVTLRFSLDGTKPVQIGEYIDLSDTGLVFDDDEEEKAEEEAEEVIEEAQDAESVTDDDLWYWAYTINGAEATVGSNAQKINEGDKIEWTWTLLVFEE